MDDHFYMYQVNSLEMLHEMDYCNRVESFINHALYIPKNINRDDIRC